MVEKTRLKRDSHLVSDRYVGGNRISMNNNNPQTKRRILILVSAIDAFLSGIVLLIYFGFLPIDISSRGISRGMIGWIGGAWFIVALAVLVYQLTRTDVTE